MSDPISQVSIWLDQYVLVIVLLILIPVGITAIWATFYVKNSLAKRSAISAKKRIAELEEEIAKLQELNKNERQLHLMSEITLFKILICFGLGWFSKDISPLGISIYLYGVAYAYSHLQLLEKIKDFDRYQNKILDAINTLKLKT